MGTLTCLLQYTPGEADSAPSLMTCFFNNKQGAHSGRVGESGPLSRAQKRSQHTLVGFVWFTSWLKLKKTEH